jgi:ankyrin repeat protein
MHIAARRGDLDTIRLLVEAGMNISEQGEIGFTALHNAYQHKHAGMVDFLLAHGASTEIQNYFGKLPGEYVAQAIIDGARAIKNIEKQIRNTPGCTCP